MTSVSDENQRLEGHYRPGAAVTPGDIMVTDAVKLFGVTRALDSCSFSAKLGEIHAIIGGNGCGKSTMAKVISGVLPIDSGHVSILGHTPTTPREARAAGIATVFQEVLVADHASVADNLFVGADSLFKKALSAREKHDTAEKIMRDLAGFYVDPDALVGDLPLSLKQWITIGRALLCKPKVLILDESSAALDFDSTERLFAKMRELKQAGSCVLIVTHRIAELVRISDRATVMRDGRDVGILEGDALNEENLLRLMTGKEASGEIGDSSRADVAHASPVARTKDMKVWEDGKPIDFDLHRGEIVGIAGLDGQGQSEFVRVLAGIQSAVEGIPEVLDASSGQFEKVRDLQDAVRSKVVYVSGDRKREGIFPNLSIFENMLIAIYPTTLKSRLGGIIDWESLANVFDWGRETLSVKIGHPSDKITSLSGGNQQKVLIGRAFALRPDILVLNDPARGIDVEAKGELYDQLRSFVARGNSVVFLSSELEEFIGLCNRVLVFRNGSIFETFHEEEIEPARILEAMFGRSARAGSAAQPGVSQDSRSLAAAGASPSTSRSPERPQRRWRLPKPGSFRILDFGKTKDATAPQSGGPTAESGRKIKIIYSDE